MTNNGMKDKIAGKIKEAEGRIEQKAGEVTNNDEMARKGMARKNEGKILHAVGKGKEAIGEVANAVKKATR